MAGPPAGEHRDSRRVKNDVEDAADPPTCCRNDLPAAWAAPRRSAPAERALRYRANLVGSRTWVKTQLDAAITKLGILRPLQTCLGRRAGAVSPGASEGAYRLPAGVIPTKYDQEAA